jgi:AraC-like DNA-binding protein
MHAKRINVDPGWRLIFKDAGLDTSRALKVAGLPMDLFERKSASLSLIEYFSMWRGLEETLGDQAFPIKLISNFVSDAFDPVIFSAFCSPDLNSAFKRLSLFKALMGPMTLHVNIAEQQTSVRYEVQGVNPGHIPYSLVASELLFFIHLARTGTREQIRPIQVITPVDLPELETYSSHFGVKPIKGAHVEVVFSALDAKRPFVTEHESMWAHFEPALRQRLRDLNDSASFTDKVNACLLEAIPSGNVSAQEIASRLLVSTRTMQRKLGDEGTSFQTLLNMVREKLARHYLASSEMTGGQIAYLLGFDDPNSFSRAFHIWTGTTPEQARAAVRH